MGNAIRTFTSGISLERTGWELKRAFYSLKGSAVMALLLLQVPVFLFVHFKGAGSIYADMIGIIVGITLFSWFLTSVVHGNFKILVFALVLLTVGTMLQCIFLMEAMLRRGGQAAAGVQAASGGQLASGGQTPWSAPAAGLQLQYILAMAAAAAASFIYYKWREISSMKVCRLLFVLSSCISIFTILFAAGTGGVKNWIHVGGLSIQTTEINKLLYIFVAAGLLGTVERPSRRRLAAFYLVSVVQAAFLMVQSEFGTLLLLLFVFFAYLFLFVPGIQVFIKTLVVFVSLTVLSGFLGYQIHKMALANDRFAANKLIRLILSAYSKISTRFIYWLHPEKDPLGLGYQLLKAKESVVLGGWFGTASVTDLPVKTSDLVYPALIQRCGMIFALLVFIIFIMMWLEGLRLFVRKSDRYHQAVAAGIVIMFFTQTMIIIAGSTGLCPLTGITLPFISSGGSSLLVCFIMIGILITISGNVRWKGTGYNDGEEFFKESPAAARLFAGIGHLGHTVSGTYLGSAARRLKRSRPEKGGGETEGLREGVHKGEHPGQEG